MKQKLQGLGAADGSVLLVYLFGSQATGRSGPGSDYDLGILQDRQQDSSARRARLAHELTTILGTADVDVVFLNQAPPELAFAVIQGQLMYERDLATRVEYEAYVMGRYYDYLPYLRAQRAEILKGGDHAARVQRYREALGRTERTLSAAFHKYDDVLCLFFIYFYGIIIGIIIIPKGGDYAKEKPIYYHPFGRGEKGT